MSIQIVFYRALRVLWKRRYVVHNISSPFLCGLFSKAMIILGYSLWGEFVNNELDKVWNEW
jgi:hypothetical protein